MLQSNLKMSIGGSRHAHAANILSASNAWKNFEALHANAYKELGHGKYVVVNADGEVLAKDADKAKLQKAIETNSFEANGTLRHEDFLTIRDVIVEVRRRKLNGITDLEEAGLSFNVDIGEQLVGFENVNEFREAVQEMNPETYENNDSVFSEFYVPNPITHQSWSVPWRQQGFDYKRSVGLRESVRQVSEKLEDVLFNGNTSVVVNFQGTLFPLYGYTTHPNRGMDTISDWTLLANRDKIIEEAVDQIGQMWSLQGGVGNDSVVMYVANDVWNAFQNDYNSQFPSKMVLNRLLDIAQIKEVKPAEKLASKQVVLVEMDSRTIELAKASDIITVPHVKTDPLQPQVSTTYAAMVAQIKQDSNGITGIRHLTI